MAPVVEKVVTPLGPLQLAETPHWDAVKQALYCVDIFRHQVHRYVPATGEHTTVDVGGDVGFAIPVEGKDDLFVAGIDKRVVLLTWDGRSSKPQDVEDLFQVDQEPGKEEYRINPGKADPSGRLWAGTMGPMSSLAAEPEFKASVFCMGEGRCAVTRITEVGLTSGLAWNSDCNTMYFDDPLRGTMDAFDFDIRNGEISNRRTIFDTKSRGLEGFTDGMTIDTEDKIWAATYDGRKILRVDPASGSVLDSIDIPAVQVTNVTFGGPALDELYVTTGSYELTEEQRVQCPDSGCLFRITGLKVKGKPGQPVKL